MIVLLVCVLCTLVIFGSFDYCHQILLLQSLMPTVAALWIFIRKRLEVQTF